MSSTAGQPKRIKHKVEWDEQKVAEFWSVFSGACSESYFSHRAGGAFLEIAKKHLGRHVLDVGCGDGFLVRQMRRRGYEAIGADVAPGEGPYLFKISGTELENLGMERFDSAVSVETFEHVLPEKLVPTLCSIARVLKPGGKLIFTVPFEERLQEETCVCPDCHAVFHRWQHQQAFTRGSLSALLKSAGFEPISFRHFVVPVPMGRLVPRLAWPLCTLLYGWLKNRIHHLSEMLVVARRI
jgi:SAM-dependent methyltransferase